MNVYGNKAYLLWFGEAMVKSLIAGLIVTEKSKVLVIWPFIGKTLTLNKASYLTWTHQLQMIILRLMSYSEI